MKPLLLAAAVLLLAPAAANAQVAAGTLPNTFDDRAARPVAAPAPQAAPAAELAPEPANEASEEILRTLVEELQAGSIDYSRMTDDIAASVREQEAVVTPVVQGFGALVSVAFVGSRDNIDMFNVIFAEAETEWMIGLTPEGKVSALLFRPAE